MPQRSRWFVFVLLVAVAAFGHAVTAAAQGCLHPWEDQNKHDQANLTLTFEDADGDTWHDLTEGWAPPPPPLGYITVADNSCWMASAANMLEHGGVQNNYQAWLGGGAAPSPSPHPWPPHDPVHADNGDGDPDERMSFDDGGWQHWALTDAGATLDGPIRTVDEFGVGLVWGWPPQDPIAWSEPRLADDRPVGLTAWWSDPPPGARPGPPIQERGWGYHAITLWEIVADPGALSTGTVWITDSDDNVGGERPVSYTFLNGDWILHNLYPGQDWYVNYAVAILTFPASPVRDTSWGKIKSLYR